jgi:hypothetical protein
MNLSHPHSMKEAVTISIEEAAAKKKAAFFHSMPASEVFSIDSVLSFPDWIVWS